MSSLSNVEAKLPPGFRFHPKDDELICDYLMKRVAGWPHPFPLLDQVDLNKCEPWDIPESACVGGKEWYFYSQKDKKYATGLRTNRATVSGYWKATGKDRPVVRKGTLVGMRKTLVFYEGRAPKGRKSDWVMHEFRLEGTHWPGPKLDSPVKEDWVLCRVFHKNSPESPGKQETGNFYDVTPSSPSLPPLMEPYTTFDQNQAGPSGHQYREQVPCFSIFSTTSPTFSLVTHTDTIMPDSSLGGTVPDLGFYNYSIDGSSSSDQMSIKAVLNHLESQPNMNGSPSFGEGSSDSYLSEVGGLPSMWNHYS